MPSDYELQNSSDLLENVRCFRKILQASYRHRLIPGERIPAGVGMTFIFHQLRNQRSVLCRVELFDKVKHQIQSSCYTRRAPDWRRTRFILNPTGVRDPGGVRSEGNNAWPGSFVCGRLVYSVSIHKDTTI